MHSNIEQRSPPKSGFRRFDRGGACDLQCETTESVSIPSIRRKSLAFLKDSTEITAVRVSDWQSASGWLNVTAEESGSNPPAEGEQHSSSPSRKPLREPVRLPLNLLLAEDNLPDALLVREAIRMENLPLEIYIAADGERAIEFIAAAETDPNAPCPDVLLLDLNLPKI